jgi:hypothetical protein
LPDAERRALGTRGYERVRIHYGLSETVERWEELYRQVLSRNGLAPLPRYGADYGEVDSLRSHKDHAVGLDHSVTGPASRSQASRMDNDRCADSSA